RADDAVSRGKVDQDYARVDAGDVAVSDLRNFPRHALGVRSAWLGRLLGMGSGGERQLHALADGHRVYALGDDAGKERDDEELERVAHLLYVPADAAGDAADEGGSGEFGARVCEVIDRHVVHGVHGDRSGGLYLYVCSAARSPAVGSSA